MKNKSRILPGLFWTMLKIGLFTFGGGYAMIALLENEFVHRKQWMEKDDFLDMTAIVGTVPGSIAVNAATYIGYRLAGVLGSVTATVAVCTPSFLIIYLISVFLRQFLDITLVAYAFRGIQICVIYLILSAGIRMFKGLKRDPFTVTLFVLSLALNVIFSLVGIRLTSVFYILAGGVLGAFFYLLAKLYKGGKGKA